MNTGERRETKVPQAKDAGNDVVVNLLLENQAAFKGFLRRHLPSTEAAEDLLQQSILKAVRNSGEVADVEKSTAWFYRILRNSLIDFYRSRAAEGRKNDAFLQNLEAMGDESHSAPDSELMREVCACMSRLLPSLKSEYADLINRIDLMGEEQAAVAESIGITQNNLMVRLHRARQALRKSLEKSCGACTKHGCLDCTCGHGHTEAH